RQGNYLFLHASEEKLSQIQFSIIVFVGALPDWQNYYQGTFSGIDATGNPFAGKLGLERLTTEQKEENYIDQKIIGFIRHKPIKVETVVPKSPEEFYTGIDFSYLIGKYEIHTLSEHESCSWEKRGDLHLADSGKAIIVFPNSNTYDGSFLLQDGHTLQIDTKYNDPKGAYFHYFIWINASVEPCGRLNRVFSGIWIKPDSFQNNGATAKSCVIIGEGVFSKPQELHTFLNQYCQIPGQSPANLPICHKYFRVRELLVASREK
ncbi:MAG: hypothetical protein AAF135_25630, partial [Bacteroidota bacterium]